MKPRRKGRILPPWWVRAPLYAALWPRLDLSEFRIRLQRKYLRALRNKGVREANRNCRRQAFEWSLAAVYRIFEVAGHLISQVVR